MKLYKKDSKGKVRVWWMETQGNKHRTHSGIHEGKIVTSEWTECVGKQGRTDYQQANFEMRAKYDKKMAQGQYVKSFDLLDAEKAFLSPMLAPTKGYVEGDKRLEFPCMMQPKLDGIRCIANVDGLWTRNGKPIVAVPHIHKALEPLFKIDPLLVFDGELYNHELRDDFNTLVSICRKQKPTAEQIKQAEVMQYHVYDLVIPTAGYKARNESLHAHLCMLDDFMTIIHYVTTYFGARNHEHAERQHKEYIEEGYEGSMLKADKPYEAGKRSKHMLKWKEWDDDEWEIIRIEEGIGNLSGTAGSVHYKMSDGREFSSGIEGGRTFNKHLWDNRDKLVGHLGTVKHFKFTPDGIPRFPRTIKVHEGGKV